MLRKGAEEARNQLPDLLDAAEVTKIARKLRKVTGLEVFPISADKSEKLAPLVAAIARMLHTMEQPAHVATKL